MEEADEFDWRARINIDPGIQAGKPVIAGTRVPVYVIVGGLASGASVKEVCHSYHVTDFDVRAALAYAAEVLAEERVYAIPDR